MGDVRRLDRRDRPTHDHPAEPEPLWRELTGRVLRRHRHDQEQTLAAVAERAGVSTQYLSEIERGRKEPSSEVLSAVGGALGLSLLDLTVEVARDLGAGHLRRAPSSRVAGPVALAA